MSGLNNLKNLLNQYTAIGLDTCIFIYHFEANPIYTPLTTAIFSRLESGQITAITSTITIAEIFTNPQVSTNPELKSTYQHLFDSWPNLSLRPLDSSAAASAGTIRSQTSLKLPDAMQLETAIHFHADAFITNDTHFSHIPQLTTPNILLLDQYT